MVIMEDGKWKMDDEPFITRKFNGNYKRFISSMAIRLLVRVDKY